ncbi:M23 family metallopeptidase [Luteimonas soli]|uniref:M23 family metallopeptidase n=1 Tax=Luteimonas soli TaxID=1648966 RepID=A0ABV7XMW5_9GAMM
MAFALLAIATAADARPVDDVQLRIEGDAGSYLAWADNTLPGPVEVMLHSDRAGVRGEPALPARATVPAHSSVLVARVHPAPAGGLGLRLETVPGSVNARPRDYEYLFPLPAGEPRVEQAWGGRHSHADAENRYAVDFAAAPGTVVFAARDGMVMRIRMAGPPAAGEHGEANLIRVLHDDGSMAVYAHLQPGGALVQPGQRVRRGRPIGLSGNSGASSAPHLHFAVQVNRGMHLESIPFRMFGDRGILRFSVPAEEDRTTGPLLN